MPSSRYQEVINLILSLPIIRNKNIYECSDVGLLTFNTLEVIKITALTLLSLLTALKFSFRIVGFNMFPLKFCSEIA
jgi:hypothetical protein